jgi:hypothetical protein
MRAGLAGRAIGVVIGVVVVVSCLGFLLSRDDSDVANKRQPVSANGGPAGEAGSARTLGELNRLEGLESLELGKLEVRENVDFLLTPALLIQSSIRGDVIAYPED